MPVSGFMTVKVAMLCSNPKQGIAACIAPMARLPVRLYRRGVAAVRWSEIFWVCLHTGIKRYHGTFGTFMQTNPAEVEKEEHINILKGMGCDQLQGYYFDRPMPFD